MSKRLTRNQLDKLQEKVVSTKNTLESKEKAYEKKEKAYMKAKDDLENAKANHEIAKKNRDLGYIQGLSMEDLEKIYENLELFSNLEEDFEESEIEKNEKEENNINPKI